MNEESFDPYDKSQLPSNPKPSIPPMSPIPDFVTKTKDYVKQHPEVIREVAGNEIAKIEEWLDSLPLGLGEIGKTKLNEFLGAGTGTGSHPNAQEGVMDDTGHENIELDGQGHGKQAGNEPEDFMTTEDVKDIIEFMAELSEQGFAAPEIADAVWRDYRIQYHPLQIRRMLKSYYASPASDEDKNENEPEPESKIERTISPVRGNALKKIEKMMREYEILKKEKEGRDREIEINKIVDEKMRQRPKCESIVSTPVPKKGLLRRFLAWAI